MAAGTTCGGDESAEDALGDSEGALEDAQALCKSSVIFCAPRVGHRDWLKTLFLFLTLFKTEKKVV